MLAHSIRTDSRSLGLSVLLLVSPLANAAGAPSSATAQSFYATAYQKRPTPAGMAAIGRSLFFDPSLSASGQTSCASCHDPRAAYGPAGDEPVKQAGSDLRQAGQRAVPSLRYAQNTPAFSEHYFDEEKDESADQGPTGGRTWDGRAASAHEQAELPLLSPLEMANRDMSEVVARVKATPYAGQIREVFGDDVFDDARLAATAVLQSLEVFQQSPPDFYPYSSRYDDYLRGKVTLSAQEQRGLSLFDDPRKGNCAVCHPSHISHGNFPQFTDFGYVAVGVPRNADIPANRDPHYFDLGLCGPLRTDLADRKQYCGFFKAPTLRNVAARRVFFHNGVVHNLEDAVRFYAERDTRPEKWYPKKWLGGLQVFNDLPPEFRANIDREPPFGGNPGESPPISDVEIKDIVAFLQTLTDRDVTVDALAGAAR